MPMPSRSLRLLFVFAVTALAACKPGPQMGTNDGGTDAGAVAGCPVSFTHRAIASASTVELTGEWNAFAHHTQTMTDTAGNGTWSGTFTVPPGHWAYSFLENGAAAADPTSTDVRTIDDNPMPAIRVADCTKAQVTVKAGSLSNTRGAAGSGAFAITLNVSGAD